MNNPQSQPRAISAVQSDDAAKAKKLFAAAAGISFLLSVGLFFTGDHERGIFVGLWVPSILSLGTLLLTGGNRDD